MNQLTRTSVERRPPLVAAAALLLSISSFARAQSAAVAPEPSQPALPANEVPAEAPPNTAPVSPAPGTSADAAPAPEIKAQSPASANAEADAAADAAANAAAEAALADTTAGGTPGDEYKLSMYGFADFTFSLPLTKNPIVYSPPTFYVGSFNLYADAELGGNWHSLGEVRFMYLPDGTVPYDKLYSVTPTPRTNTAVPDYNDINRPVKWGGIAIQRVYLEYRAFSWLTVRAGQFLTPYGIWNVDHGSPAIIGVHRPYIIGEALFPAAQTGLELYGSGLVGPVELGFDLTLSNGRGPVDTYADFDHNKAIGGKLFARHRSDLGVITLGFSGYRGKYSDRVFQSGVDANNNLMFYWPLQAQYDELSLGLDLKWERHGFLLQSEAILNDMAYNERTRPPVPFPTQPGGFLPDHRRYGMYGITGYRFDFLGIMPWIGSEYCYVGPQSVSPDVAAFMLGLNIRPTARVVLKAEYTHVWFPTVSQFGDHPMPLNLLDVQAAWSF